MAKSKTTLVTYQWTGINRSGTVVKGVIEANSPAFAKANLHTQGIFIKTISKKRAPLFDKNNKKITSLDVAVFTRQLATMLKAGIPLIQSFDIVGKGQKNRRIQALIDSVKKDVENGLSFSESLRKHPIYFNELYCNLVDSGEKSGCLEVMLDRIATYKEKTESIRKKIKKALTYPTAVLVIAFIVTAIMLIFVVPQFESLFKGFGAQLPALTQMVVSLSRLFQAYWFVIFSAIAGGIFAFASAKKRSLKFSQAIERAMLKFPVIGVILEKAAIARFARTLSITFAAGLPLVDALKLVSGATGNILYAKATMQIRDEVSTGQQMKTAMENTGLFPVMVIQMIAIGEESGTLDQMLGKVADFYEEEVDNAVDALSSLIEPVMMAVLGVLVGGLVVAMYLPIFKLGSVV